MRTHKTPAGGREHNGGGGTAQKQKCTHATTNLPQRQTQRMPEKEVKAEKALKKAREKEKERHHAQKKVEVPKNAGGRTL